MKKINIKFNGQITIIFIVLKLVDVIQWSWWWVFCPIWIPLIVALLLLLIWWFFVANSNSI